jgi:hypothetical protein
METLPEPLKVQEMNFSPPSPEGELMETSTVSSRVFVIEIFPSPPSPEGELMETLQTHEDILSSVEDSPPSPEGELMETSRHNFFLIFKVTLTAFA